MILILDTHLIIELLVKAIFITCMFLKIVHENLKKKLVEKHNSTTQSLLAVLALMENKINQYNTALTT